MQREIQFRYFSNNNNNNNNWDIYTVIVSLSLDNYWTITAFTALSLISLIHGYYKRNRHFQRYVVSKPLA